MADQYEILGFDMYDISGPQRWGRKHGLTSDDKVAGAMPVYMRGPHGSGSVELNEPRPIGIDGPLGAWERSRGINRYDVLSGPHGGHGGHHGGGHRGRRSGGSYPFYPTYYGEPTDAYVIVSDEVLDEFKKGRDFVGGLIAPAIPGVSLVVHTEYLIRGKPIQPNNKPWLDGVGWNRPTDNAWAKFEKARGRTPTAAEQKMLKAHADGINAANDAHNERLFEYRWRALDHYVRNGVEMTREQSHAADADAGKIVALHKSQYKGGGGGLFGKIASDIGSAVHTVTHAAASVYKAADNVASKVPVLGTPLHAALQLQGGNLVHTVDAIANGANISKVAVSSLKDNLTNAATLSQYASVITSAIPGLGTAAAGVNGALAAANAISQGKPVTDALISAVKDAAIGAVPGGALAQKAASEAFEIGKSLANGERLDRIALDRARAQLPPYAQHVFDAGLAVAQGKKLQDVLVKGVAALAPAQLASEGEKLMAYSEPLRRAALALTGESRKGFQTATALLARTGVPINAVVALRNKLPAAQRDGFDKSVAEHALCYTAFRRV